MNTDIEHSQGVPEQQPIEWLPAARISWRSIRRRFLRSLITMCGVILAIAFLAYVLINESFTKSLIAANDEQLDILLQKAGVDIFVTTGTDQTMILLISLSLLACLVGVINAMLMSVTERIKEIGTLKCLGATDSFIVRIFFIESSLQGIMGTAIGTLLGLTVVVLIAFVNFKGYALSYFPVWPVIRNSLITFTVGCLISITAGIAPAYMAAKKQPVDDMRREE